jgi:hypothetical protein
LFALAICFGGSGILAVVGISPYLKAPLTRIIHSSVQPHGEHITWCRVQNRVLGEVQEQCKAVTLAAAENDQVGLQALSRSNDLGLDASGFNELGPIVQTQLRGELGQSLARTID